jgi:prevent-host-death family protein
MVTVNMHEAKTTLSKLVVKASKGEAIVIARAGKPMAKLVPMDAPTERSSWLGSMRGQFTVPDDFDTMGQDEIIRMFEGE